jgi:hypothetical protein
VPAVAVDQQAALEAVPAAGLQAQAVSLRRPILQRHKRRLHLQPVQAAEGAAHSMAAPYLVGE